jgi:peptide chain release factor subunit 1
VRLVQLAGPSGGTPLSFHPQITVVGGLDDACRVRLLDALRALPSGAEPGWEGLIEAHGVVLDLDRESLRLLGLQHDVDVVVGAGDLPGDGETVDRSEGLGAAVPAGPEEQIEGLRLSHDILAHGVAALKRTRIEFEEARLQAVEAIEEARADLDPFATTAFEQAAAQLRRAEEAEEHEPPPDPVPVESLEDLEAERDRLKAEVAALEGVDVTAVAEALHRAERAEPNPDGRDLEVIRTLADELAAAEKALAELDERRREEGRDPADLLRRIEAARIQLERLEASSAPPTIDPADVAVLEKAHEQVLEADSKVNASRIGGKAARQRLDEVVAEETAILTRMGFPTYSAFALAQSAPGPDPETRVELETTRNELAGAEAAYQAVLADGDDDGERDELVRRRDDLRRDAAALAEAADPDDLVNALRGLAEVLASDDERTTAMADLRSALAERGVDFADLDLADDEVVDVARVWLADVAQLAEERAALEHELDTVEARLLVVAPVLNGDAAGSDPQARAQTEVEAAEARLARHRQASDRVAELCGLLEEIESKLADLGENIAAQESLVSAAGAGLAATEAHLAGEELDNEALSPEVEELFGLPEGVDDTEWYLLTRQMSCRSSTWVTTTPWSSGPRCGAPTPRSSPSPSWSDPPLPTGPPRSYPGQMTTLDDARIRELAAFRPAQGPVTSCYLDVDGRRFPRRAEYEAELERLLRQARARVNGDSRTVAPDLAAIERHVKDGVDRSKVRGVAMFSCVADGFWHDLALPVPVRNQLVVGHAPAVGQLEAVLHHYEPIGVLLVDRQQARVLVFALGELSEHDEVVDELLRDVDDRDEKARGDTQSKVEDHDRRHVRHAAEAVFAVYQRHPFEHLLLGAPAALAGTVEDALHPYLRDRLRERVPLTTSSTVADIRDAAITAELALERQREQGLLDELRGRLGRSDRAVAGLTDVLAAVADRRVERLLVSSGYREEGWTCPACGTLAVRGPHCPRCRETMQREEDVVASAIDAALTASCRVDVCDGSADLDVLGRIGALLRF